MPLTSLGSFTVFLIFHSAMSSDVSARFGTFSSRNGFVDGTSIVVCAVTISELNDNVVAVDASAKPLSSSLQKGFKGFECGVV